MIISCITLLPIDNSHAVGVDIGIAIKRIPVKDNVKELVVVALITIVSNDFNIVVNVFYFVISFSIYSFHL